MIDVRSQGPVGEVRDLVLNKCAVGHDAETRLAASFRAGEGCEASPVRTTPANARGDAGLRRVAADIKRNVQLRLPGRIRDLKVSVEEDRFVLSGVSRSYYVKQVAQHVAMTALDSLMLGRLVNEIQVSAAR